MTFASLTQRNNNSDLFAWAHAQAYSGHYRIYDPSFGLSRDPDLPAKMRRDPIIDMALRHRQQMVAGRKWDVEPGGADDASVLKASIVRDMLENIQRFDQTRYRLAEACFRGASYESVEGDFVTARLGDDTAPRRWWAPMLTKHVDKRMLRQVNEGGGRMLSARGDRSDTPRTGLPGINISWEMFGNEDRQWHKLDGDTSRSLIRHTYDMTMSTLGYGGGLIEPLYWYFFCKGIALEEGLRGLETWSRGWVTAQIDGLRKGSTDKDNDDRVANAITKLENMRSRHVMVYGEDMELKVEHPSGAGQSIVMDYISYLDESMVRLILGSLLPSGGGSDTGSFARAETEAETTETQVQFDQGGIEESLSSDLIGLCCYVNRAVFAEAGCLEGARPQFLTVREKVEDPAKNAELVDKALRAGVPLSKAWVYEKIGAPVPEEGEEVFEGVPEPAAPAFGGMFGGGQP